MGKVMTSISMSLDGFVAGANISPELPLGKGGERLHDWMFSAKTPADAQIVDETNGNSGAVIVGWRTYADAIEGAWGSVTPFAIPAFILTRNVPAKKFEGFTYVTDGIESALTQARAIAGDKNVWVMGGGNVVQQYIKAGLLDELQVSIAPILLGSGTRLFDHIGPEHIELENTRSVQTPQATHLRFTILRQNKPYLNGQE